LKFWRTGKDKHSALNGGRCGCSLQYVYTYNYVWR